MKKKIIYILFFLLVTTRLAIPQVQQEWAARYNGPFNGDDEASSIAVDALGNVYVTGLSFGSGTYSDYATIKYNPSGAQQWVAIYNGPGNDEDDATALALDGSGNVYVTGRSAGIGTGSGDYATIKYNSSGVQQWVQRYNGPGNATDYAYSIAVDASGNVYVTGMSDGSTGRQYATIKYNSSGVQQWVARYSGQYGGNNEAYSIAVDTLGFVYVTGRSDGSNSFPDFATIKYNTSGDSIWIQRYNGPGNNYDYGLSITVDGSGNVYVTGSSTGSGTLYDYATIKYNSSGIQQWVQRYNGPGNSDDNAFSVALDASGNVFVTGRASSGTSYDYATIKYNSQGVQQWAQSYNGPGNSQDVAYSIAVDTSSNTYVTGYSRTGSSFGTEDYATIKYNSSGVQQWVQRYNGPGNNWDIAYSMALDGSGNVYVTGGSTGSGTGYSDYATIKYSQLVGITPVSDKIPQAFRLYQNYPNPFNPETKIKFDVPTSNLTLSEVKGLNVALIIYDNLGREVETLVNEELKPGTYEIMWQGAAYSSGVYFCRLISGEMTITKSMVLLK